METIFTFHAESSGRMKYVLVYTAVASASLFAYAFTTYPPTMASTPAVALVRNDL